MPKPSTLPPPDERLGDRGGHRGGGRPGGGPGPARIDPADRAQLAESPVRLTRVAGLFRPHRGPLLIVTAIVVATSVAGLANPFLLREIIDVALPRQDVRLLLIMVGLMLAVTVVTQLLGVLQTWIATQVGERVMHTLRTRVFSHLQRQSMSFFTGTRSGEVTSRLTNDIGGMQSVVTSTATSIATNITTVVATAIAMVALSWQLSLFTLLVLPPAIWLTRRVARLRREMTLQQQRRMADLTNQIDEGLSVSGALLTKTMGAEQRSAERFARTSSDLVDLALRSELAGRWRMATMSVIFAAIPALIYLSAGLPMTAGAMTIGTIVAFTSLQNGLFRPLMGLLDVGVTLNSSLALFARIFEYLDLPVDVDDPADPVAIDPEAVRGDVRMEGVTFSYPGSDVAAVAGVDLDVPAGSTLALVGETGSGKSTLAALVARLYDPTGGRITIDGVDLRDMTLSDLSRVVGVVSQETYLLHTTVRENLRYARPEATDAQIVAAARTAQVHDMIMSLPDGYDTMVGSRGHRFSGGEKQRIAIARTLLRDPKVLVLDEATSALDNETERAVQEAFDTLSGGRTTITIAHRLTTVRDADQIAVVDQGRIVERGTHDSLLAGAGHYAALSG